MITFVPGLFLVTILACIHGSHQATCDENEFRCSNGKCIDNFLVCDGEKNCEDGSDETKNVCSKTQVVCQPFAFRCAYGACIDGHKKCDGKQDCADNSDESNADCKSSANNSTNSNTNCLKGSFQCESGQCISEWAVCDGESNCRDGSDESDSLCVNFPCPKIVGFQCSYGGCVDKDKQCNGVRDCRDGSDEDPILCGQPTSKPINQPTEPIHTWFPPRPDIWSEGTVQCTLGQWKRIKTRYFGKPGRLDSESQPVFYQPPIDDAGFISEMLQLFTKCNSGKPQYINTIDDIYGQYVSQRLKNFNEGEREEIRHKIDNLFYTKYKNKNTIRNLPV